LALCSLAALKMKRGAVPARAGTHLAPSMQCALLAVRDGVHGRLETALRRTGAATPTQTPSVAHVLAALDQARVDAGLPAHLARRTRAVTETPQTVSLVVEAQRLSYEALQRVVPAVEKSLGSPVHLERVGGGDGRPCIRVTLTRASLTAPQLVSPHPAPLLVPLGHTAERVVHVNLGRLGAVLVAGGAQGSNTLVATLLASIVAQAAPSAVRLLVASRDDDLRAMLPILEHLEAPPADAGDVTATAALVEQVYRVVLDRFAGGTDGTQGPAYLVVLDTVETLCRDPRALDRLDVICRNGRACGVHVLATTSDPSALVAAGMLEPFGARLARTLRAEESALVCGDERAVMLGLGEIVFRDGPLGTWEQLSPFVLTLPEVREVFAAVAIAQAPDVPKQEPVGPPAQRDRGVDPQDTLPETAATSAGTPTAALSVGEQNDGSSAPDAGVPEVESAGEVSMGPTQQRDAGGPSATAEQATPPEVRPHAAATLVEVRVLGTIAAVVQGRPVEMQPREQRVLAALAIMGPKPVRADRLVEAIFADDDADSGHSKLRHAIADLRAALRKAGLPAASAKAVVGRTSAGYYLDAALVQVDAYLFSDLLARSRTAPRAERGHLLAQVVEVYTGDLCGDQAQTWVDEWSYSWRKDYLQALYELARYREQDEHDLLGALRLAQRLVTEEPLTDRYHQMVMELLAAQGDNDGVEQQYQAYRAEMDEAGLEIDPDIHALYERLRTQKAG
jgi:DNA-binding SARP family transcriptional activator